MQTTPLTLLERVRQGSDSQAWERIVELYAPLLFRWARQAGADDHDAADLVQDVFAILIQTLPTFQYNPGGKFRNWLRTITVNKFRDRQRRKALMQQVPWHDGVEPVAADGPDEFWEKEYREELVRRTLQILESDFTPVTWKAFWEFVPLGRPAGEVARELGITENAVYLSKCRVLRRLRAELEGLL